MLRTADRLIHCPELPQSIRCKSIHGGYASCVLDQADLGQGGWGSRHPIRIATRSPTLTLTHFRLQPEDLPGGEHIRTRVRIPTNQATNLTIHVSTTSPLEMKGTTVWLSLVRGPRVDS